MAGRGGECLLLFGLVHLEGGFGVKTRKQRKIALCSWDWLAKTPRAVSDSWLRRALMGTACGKEGCWGRRSNVGSSKLWLHMVFNPRCSAFPGIGCGAGVGECPQPGGSMALPWHRWQHSVAQSRLCSMWKCTQLQGLPLHTNPLLLLASYK